jgi:NAD(P)-dependent dehydrogenase (short-subunit alcohol dehydrogenase family)
MDLKLQGKVALVTGVGSQIGMGKAIALALAREGCDIVATDIDLNGAQQTGSEIRALGRKALVVKANVVANTEVNEMVKAGLKEFGKIDILINTAGGTTFSGFLAEAKLEDIDKEINLNLMGTIYCTKSVLPGMIAQKSGKIVNLASNVAYSGMPSGSGYSAAKAGVMGFTRAVAREVGPSGINVNAIAPGLTLTNFYSNERAPKLPPQVVQNKENPMAPTRRITTVQDIANAVLFLVSDMSRNITGHTICIDGGQTMP